MELEAADELELQGVDELRQVEGEGERKVWRKASPNLVWTFWVVAFCLSSSSV